MEPPESSSQSQSRLYGDLAWTWPVISPPEAYVKEGEELITIINQYSRIQPKTVLHLGSGGGHNDFTLKKQFDVTGIDKSETMLALAKQLNPDVTYLRDDMRTARLKKPFDIVLASDSINHMINEEDLRLVFQTAFANLRKGGLFITFAEETVDRFEQSRTFCSTHAKGETEIVFVQNIFDPDPDDTTYELTLVFLIRNEGTLHIETDRHLCGLFRKETWRTLLQETGFEINEIEFEAGSGCPLFICLKF
ncbi:MAG: class I SAM-dependent methyltransferase [bacterium]